MNIYQWEKDYKVQLELLKNAEISDKSRQMILKLVKALKREKGITQGREIILLRILRQQALEMKEAFLNPSKKNIEDLIDTWNAGDFETGTVNLKKQIAKQFYKWYFEDQLDSEVPRFIKKGIKQIQKRSEEEKPDTLTDEEIQKLIDACPSSRDKCLVTLLNDSGVRIGEALGIRIKDIEQTDYGMKVSVSRGKTGYRTVVIAGRSIIYLKRWLNDHPDSNNIDSYLFLELNNGHNRQNEGKPLKHYVINSLMIRLRKRTGIQIYAHMFRHSAASRLAGVVPEAILEKQFGWIPGSKMSSVYVKTNDTMQENSILSGLGIKHAKAVETYKPIKCGRCRQENESDAKYCHNCFFPLTTEEAIKQEEKEKQVSNAISDLISNDQKVLLQNLPQEAKLDALSILLLDLESSGKLNEVRQRIKGKDGQ